MAQKKVTDEQMVEVEMLTDLGIPSREGYITKGERTTVSVSELAKNPESYALVKKPSAALEGKVAELQEEMGVPEKSSLADATTAKGTIATAPDYETDPTKYDEHVEEMAKKSKGSKK